MALAVGADVVAVVRADGDVATVALKVEVGQVLVAVVLKVQTVVRGRVHVVAVMRAQGNVIAVLLDMEAAVLVVEVV